MRSSLHPCIPLGVFLSKRTEVPCSMAARSTILRPVTPPAPSTVAEHLHSYGGLFELFSESWQRHEALVSSSASSRCCQLGLYDHSTSPSHPRFHAMCPYLPKPSCFFACRTAGILQSWFSCQGAAGLAVCRHSSYESFTWCRFILALLLCFPAVYPLTTLFSLRELEPVGPVRIQYFKGFWRGR